MSTIETFIQESKQVTSIANPLLGHLTTNDRVMIDSIRIEVIKSFNVYKLVNDFNQKVLKDRPKDIPVMSHEFVDWLKNNQFICLVTQRLTMTELVNNTNYRVYPFYPDYKDVLWCSRVLKESVNLLKPHDVYLLSLYREIEFNGQSVEKVIADRNFSEIIELIADLDAFHDKQILIHTQYALQ